MTDSALLQSFIDIVGRQNCLTHEDDLAHYVAERRGNLTGETPLILKPADTLEVSAILILANDTRTSIVPQGGHTGMCGGGVPLKENASIVVSLERMNAIRDIDLEGNTLSVDAGVVLETIQNVASDNDRLFPLSLGAQGSCMIGGNISTNAGGTGVLAYGPTRDLVMGLEVVLADGRIWNGLNRLRKNNTGYDLKNLFIGAEGTLGIVTGAVLKLFPKPVASEVAYFSFHSPQSALDFFKQARDLAGNQLTGFELVPRMGIEMTLNHFDEFSDPLENAYPWYALVQVSSLMSSEDARQLMEKIFSAGMETGNVLDGALASSIEQQQKFWQMRENISHAQKLEGKYQAHDVSVPISKVPELIERGEPLVHSTLNGARMVAYGHMGDGNIHFNFMQPKGMSAADFEPHRAAISDAVYGLVGELGGAISAEHGIGLIKRDLLARVKDPVELEMMAQMKRTLDPNNIMNPGKVLKV